jgi:Na+/alanine symporter
MKEKFKLKYGDQLSKVFIITFFVAVFNSLLFYITFTIKDNNREIQQPSVLVQLILSIILFLVFLCMAKLETIYTLDQSFYGSLAALNAVNCVLLGIFYGYNKKNYNNDTDNKKKNRLFIAIYFFNLAIFGLSIFLCTKMFKSFLKC